ncbi:transaldolase family protein [Marinicellulosiphila megalodicopiae]|uniref:transaldolase family protein n=1 Tax=Marinicellulosiphila megalodicopiae TaxID=2724896 RepID=UPI003BAF2094
MNILTQLKTMTEIVADTGDIDDIQRLTPQDATTNPSLVLKAIQSGLYDEYIVQLRKEFSQISDITNRLIVKIGTNIFNSISGLVSTEVDARYSFDIEKTIIQAKEIIELYKLEGVDTSRILIKIAATWEGIQAVNILESQGIHCNVTLIFCDTQAFAAADVNATLISPFVGRITDWYQAQGQKIENGVNDPGVKSVKSIYEQFKSQGIQTIIMGASFRNTGQIIQLAGCDKLTISPVLLDELKQIEQPLTRQLKAQTSSVRNKALDKQSFIAAMEQNTMAKEKLAQGIEGFINDQIKLETLISIY